MNTDYAKWQKYDIDAELDKVATTHKKEDYTYDKQVDVSCAKR